jgi:CBS domain-containing protein
MSIVNEIQRGVVGHLDLQGYVQADASAPVAEVLRLMCRYDRTTALITRDDRIAGIFTERDVLKKIAGREEVLDRPVSEFMTPDPTVIGPEANILSAVRVMNEGHFRDIPVVNAEGKILGNLTDNAIVSRLADRLQAEVINLPPDPNQIVKTVDGA